MAVTVTIYNHTRARFLSGANAVGDEYIINLYTVLPANLTATTKTAAESGATQLSTANGYTQNAKVLASPAATIVTTDDGMLDAPDVEWTASGAGLTANFAMVYNNTDTDDPPVFRVDFGVAVTAAAGIPLLITWDAGGIFSLT
jgi:hypothetical protein